MNNNPLLFNNDAEVRVLTAIMNNNTFYYSAGSLLSEELFYAHKNAHIYDIIKNAVSEGKNADCFYVSTELLRENKLNEYTAQEAMQIFGEYVPDTSFGQDVALLRELCKRRQYWELGQRLIRIGTDLSFSLEKAMTEVNKVIEKNDEDTKSVISLKEANAILLERVTANLHGTSDTLLETGFSYLDSNGGFQLGDFDVIAADSSAGKTSLATKIMVNIASKGKPCMSYSMEMMPWQIAARINAPKANTPANVIQYKRLTEDQFRDLQNVVKETDELPIYFDDKSTTSADAILASIRMNARKGIKFFMIDYLQILSAVGMVKDQEKFLGEVSRKFKNLAKELNVNITVLSQLARNNQDPRPTLARVRASGQIVEAADTVLLIWRPSMYGKSSYKDSSAPVNGTAEIIIGKGRNIGTGSFIVHFDKSTTNFYDATAMEQQMWNTVPPSTNGSMEAPPPPLGENTDMPF